MHPPGREQSASRNLIGAGLATSRAAPVGDVERGSWLKLTGAFELGVDGRQIGLPLSAQRVLAYLGLARRAVTRSQCAGALWECDTEMHASSNLRTALWRMKRLCGELVIREQDRIALIQELAVEVGEITDLVERLVRADEHHDYPAMASLLAERELLPTWSDTWVVAERERLRLLRLHALEAAAVSLAPHRPEAALLAAMAAVRTEPLQESAWRIAVSIHLQQGNLAAAHCAYRDYRLMLSAELGVEPSPLMEGLIARLAQGVRRRPGSRTGQ